MVGKPTEMFYHRRTEPDEALLPDEWIVDKILDHKFDKGQYKFLTQWEGSDEHTWEPVGNFIHRYSSDFVKYCRKEGILTELVQFLTAACVVGCCVFMWFMFMSVCCIIYALLVRFLQSCSHTVHGIFTTCTIQTNTPASFLEGDFWGWAGKVARKESSEPSISSHYSSQNEVEGGKTKHSLSVADQQRQCTYSFPYFDFIPWSALGWLVGAS